MQKKPPHFAQEIFRAYDIRGIVDENLTPDILFKIGQALGAEAQAQHVNGFTVARDGRLSGLSLSQSLIEGLCQSGHDVTDIGAVPTPVLYFATHCLSSPNGAVVTGSHNPSNYNGIKMVINGHTLSGESIQGLAHRIESDAFVSGAGTSKTLDISERYQEAVLERVQMGKRRLKVVIDCGNGITGHIAPKLFEALGCEVIALYAEVDGSFPNHHPDPSDPNNCKDLIAAIKNEQADLGLAFDGDGDRLGVVSDQGEIIWPDRIMMLFAQSILKSNPNAHFIYDVKCSQHLKQVIESNGGQAEMWKTGHSLIKAKLKETNATLAGEMSGHFFFNDRWFGFDDALYAGARLLEILSHSEQPLSDYFSKLPNSVNTPEIKITIPESRKLNFIEDVIKQCPSTQGTISTLDGLRIDYDYGFGLVRASNTTPCLVCRFEANDTKALETIKQTFRDLLLGVDETLEIPF